MRTAAAVGSDTTACRPSSVSTSTFSSSASSSSSSASPRLRFSSFWAFFSALAAFFAALSAFLFAFSDSSPPAPSSSVAGVETPELLAEAEALFRRAKRSPKAPPAGFEVAGASSAEGPWPAVTKVGADELGRKEVSAAEESEAPRPRVSDLAVGMIEVGRRFQVVPFVEAPSPAPRPGEEPSPAVGVEE